MVYTGNLFCRSRLFYRVLFCKSCMHETEVITKLYYMLKNSSLEYMNEMYDKYKDNFQTSLHSTLWRLFVDWKHDKLYCFVQNYKPEGNILGIATANEPGYTPTMTYFKQGTTYEQAGKILDEMNADIFGHNHETAMQITASSMQGAGDSRKRKFNVTYEWQMWGSKEIEAESEEEAIQLANKLPLPEGEYIKGTLMATIGEPDEEA
jgi:hypothetical protein